MYLEQRQYSPDHLQLLIVDNVGHVSVSGNKDIASNGGQCKCYHSIFNSTGTYSNMSFENCEAISNTANLFEDKTAAQPNYRIKKRGHIRPEQRRQYTYH